jgi:hypothetical protein
LATILRSVAIKRFRTRTRRRWSRVMVGIVVALVVALDVGTAAFQLGLPWAMRAGDHNHVYDGDGAASALSKSTSRPSTAVKPNYR